ncbi:MAG: helix-turn-helix domain containing protein [Candidatus Binatia bacterium]|nr:helix-turn-helix domain containing protein [Candidatus Binatia bacterium]
MATAPPITGSADTESSTATRILDVAEQLFAERGFAAVSVREIAGRVSLNQASIYNHFSSKQALYEAVLERGFAPIRLLLERGAAELDGAEAGDDFLESLVDQLWQTPNLPKLLQREILDDGPYLERLAEQWLRPIVVAGRDAMGAAVPELPENWAERDIPFVILGMYGFLFGHFVSAALMRRVLGVDPFSDEMRKAHAHFLKKATRRLMGSADVE